MTKKMKRTINILFLLIVLALGAWLYWQLQSEPAEPVSFDPKPFKDQFLLEVIDCGQGDSILAKTPDGDVLLVDAGDKNAGDEIQNALKKQNIDDIDLLVSTHPHADHTGSMQEILEQYTVHQVLLTETDYDTETYTDVLETIDRENIKKTYAEAGGKMQVGDMAIEILGPVKPYEDINDRSIVLRLTYRQAEFLLTGDAEAESEKDILKKFGDIHADVLKVGHHGSESSTTERFLKAVDPDYAAISVGTGNDYGHPHKETVDLLHAYNIPAYRTDLSGSIYFYSDGQHITVRTEN